MDKKSASLGAAATLLVAGGLFAGISLANADNNKPAPTPASTVSATPSAAPEPAITATPTPEPVVTITPTPEPAPVVEEAPAPAPVVEPAPVIEPVPAPVVEQPVIEQPVPNNNFGTPEPGDIKNQDKGKQPTDGSTYIPIPTPEDLVGSPKR